MSLLLRFAGLLAVPLAPFALAQVGGWRGARPLYAELGSTLGIAALGVFALVLILPTRLRALRWLGADAAVRLHRRLVNVVLVLLAGHIALAVIAQPTRWHLAEFVGQPWRAQAAVASVACLFAMIALSARRRRLRLSYSAWRALHGGLALAAVTLAVAHTFGWHRYLVHGGGTVALILLLGIPAGAFASLRLSRRDSTFVLERVVVEAGRSATLHLRAADGVGHRFEPGQFAWLRLSGTRTRFTEHPFSYTSSSTDPSRVSFTVRAYDGFSARVAQLPAGTRFDIDGPHGAYHLRRRTRGVALIAYGIGITPSISILRTAADRRDTRRYTLFYANRHRDDITFHNELACLRDRLDLKTIHVLSQPPADWAGERGRLTPAVLQRHLPADLARWDFFLCGAPAPVDAGTAALIDIGVPPEAIHAERFVDV